MQILNVLNIVAFIIVSYFLLRTGFKGSGETTSQKTEAGQIDIAKPVIVVATVKEAKPEIRNWSYISIVPQVNLDIPTEKVERINRYESWKNNNREISEFTSRLYHERRIPLAS